MACHIPIHTCTTRQPPPADGRLVLSFCGDPNPIVYLSYAWGGEKEAVVDRLHSRLERAGYDVRRDKSSMRTGDWISEFMLEIGRGARVITVITERYVRSSYCMRELLSIYQQSLADKEDFLGRVTPVVLEDARIGTLKDRLSHVRHWHGELRSLRQATKGIPASMWGGTVAELAMLSDFAHRTEEMLRHLNDVLLPRGILDVESNDFAAVLEALGRHNRC